MPKFYNLNDPNKNYVSFLIIRGFHALLHKTFKNTLKYLNFKIRIEHARNL